MTWPSSGASFSASSRASPTPISSCCSPPCSPIRPSPQAYREAPAAKQLHHAWLGGLLEHVVSLLTLADRVAPHYPLLDRDLLLTGVILHDIGKVRELSWEIGFEYTVEGSLLGHIQIGTALTERAIDSLPNFPPRLKTLVLHMILSHHGKLEFGSPKLPMIPEALALSFLDDLDAKMQAIQRVR
jgi:3'-5' exoribonuclease